MQASPVEGPWQTLYMDLMGPYTKAQPGGYQYILVVVDGFSGRKFFLFVQLHPPSLVKF
jgi:hypothetical protein